ncbi:RNA polymerase II mediator complex subunit [Exophiala xenobiotica]|nr:RNA polymerase II mediator complex subunit [Exophiala xenobiotica]KAK5252554.1 RNA polymerase II mediator complex subunit [Exophiala xenobiotica]KAK5347452.1 RNA polymerase II mediator complex subunit [Exophiala xenobiotica]KAK5359836.1 RNA polymerase II mediator complex subunit [Exophiala xenobiotica]KAK5364054.1 RNA polymerase II mediator complex subunit [Exophiala xenobiotica]
MSQSRSISLLIPSEASLTSEDLQSQIQRIVVQKGHFRHVTERSLLADIQGKAPTADRDSDRVDEPESEEDESPQKRQERVWKRREEMIERLSYAQNEILCALDFVSLLISKQWVPAQNSMSPALKEAVPVGTLAGRVLRNKPTPAPVRRQFASTSQGWRSEGFRSASEKLSVASNRLRQEAEREAEYWAQIAKLTTQGWAISRLPRDRKAIGVHFGFPQSTPQFRDKGFALLRQLDDGSVTLDGQSAQRRRKALGVFVIRHNTRTGFFHFKTPKTGQAEDISQQTTEMRDSLFEEELFYEICREARIVANQGINTRAQAVEIDVGSDYQLALVYDHDLETNISTNPDDNLIAEFVAVSLRLLLNAAHEQNLIRKSQKAPAMTLKPRHLPEYALIRPVLAHLRHRAEAAAFRKSCQEMIHPFKQAGLPVAIEIEKSSTALFQGLHTDASGTILSEMMAPAKTGFKISLTDGKEFEIGLATFLGPPLFGSRYETSAVEFAFSKIPISRQDTREAALLSTRHMLMLDLVAHAEAVSRQVSIPSDAEKGNPKKWAVSQPHNGELSLYDTGAPVKRVVLSAHSEAVVVQVRNLRHGSSSKPEIWSWTSGGCSTTGGVEGTVEAHTTFDAALTKILNDGL